MGRQTAFWPNLAAGGEEKGDRRETKAKSAMAAMASYQELRIWDKAAVLGAASHLSPGCLAPSHLVCRREGGDATQRLRVGGE